MAGSRGRGPDLPSSPVAIAGGGLAGAAASCLLALAGRDAILIEREAGPRDKVCGEFLSREAQLHLAGLGLDLAALGARPVGRVRLAHGRRVAEAALPFAGLGLSRAALDEALLRHAEACGARVLRGRAVRRVTAGEGGLDLVLDGDEILRAGTLFLATGKHELRGAARRVDGRDRGLIGFKTYFALSPAQARALDGAVELVPFRGGYAGLQPVEGNRANLCLLVGASRFARAGSWDSLLDALQAECPHLATRLSGAAPLRDRPVAIAHLPYGFVHAAGPADLPGLFRLGDQMGVIPSFCGDGMSIALHSARVAVEAFVSGQGAVGYHRRMRADILRPVRIASVLAGLGGSAAGRAALGGACRAFPGLMRVAAGLTRVPDSALERVGVM